MDAEVTALETRLLARVRAGGPIGFDEFMEAALYDPADGFYMQAGSGPGRDFVTSPELSPLFGAMLARAVEACHAALGAPAPFTLCEVGAGRGSLLADLLGAAADAGSAWLADLEVAVVERRDAPPSPASAFRASPDLAGVGPFTGVLLANEVLDNLPVKLREPGGEVRVGEKDGRLAFVLVRPGNANPLPLPEGESGCLPSGVRVDPVGIRRFLAEVSQVLVGGYAILVDYGARSELPLRTFSAHELGEDALAEPGRRDVTASIDWSVVEEEARGEGLVVVGRRTQRDVLVSLGLRSSLEALRAAELAAVRRQDLWTSFHLRDQRTRAAALVDPEGPGRFDVLVLGRAVPLGIPWEPSAPVAT